jgi:hypothetical protein
VELFRFSAGPSDGKVATAAAHSAAATATARTHAPSMLFVLLLSPRAALNATPFDSGVSYWHGNIEGSNDGDAGYSLHLLRQRVQPLPGELPDSRADGARGDVVHPRPRPGAGRRHLRVPQVGRAGGMLQPGAEVVHRPLVEHRGWGARPTQNRRRSM